MSDTQWLYADIFLPIFLPTLDLRTGQPVNGKVISRGLTELMGAQENLDGLEQSLSNLTNSTGNVTAVINVVKRAISKLTTKSSLLPEVSSVYDYYQYDITAAAENGTVETTTRTGRAVATTAVSFEQQYPVLSNLFSGSGGIQGGLAALLNPQFIKGTTIKPVGTASIPTRPTIPANFFTRPTTSANTFPPRATTEFNFGQSIGSAMASGTSVNINPISLFDLINSISTGNVLTSTTGLLSMITPLLTLLPFDTIFPENTKEQNLALIKSIPEFVKLFEFFNSFQLIKLENKDPLFQLAQWKKFIVDLKAETMRLLSILLNIGVIKESDMDLIKTILATNFETISDPEVIGKVVLGCQGLNIWGVVTPKDRELRRAMSNLQLIFDIGDLVLDTTLKFVDKDINAFTCTNNPLDDYYRLTKNMNILLFADRMKSLILERPTPESSAPIPTLNCMKIDAVYRKAIKIEAAVKAEDENLIIAKKFSCFRNSIMLPSGNIIEQFRNIFSSVEENAETVGILSSGMNKFGDLIKLFNWFSKFFQPTNGQASLVSDPELMKKLLDDLPQLSDDLAKFGLSLQGLDQMQAKLDISDLERLKTGNSMFELLDTLKTYEPVITVANKG